MKTLKTRLSNFIKGWGIVIFLNLIVIAVFSLMIIETFFWKEVPYDMQHLTKDLSAYLIYFRTITITLGCLFLIAIDTYFFLASRPTKKNKEREKEEEQKEDSDNID